jgi:hypothetical protein
LSNAEWKLGFTIGLGQAPRLRILKARNLDGLEREIELAKEPFGLPKEAAVFSCYEAGRDGFWLHRFLEAKGVNNLVVAEARQWLELGWYVLTRIALDPKHPRRIASEAELLALRPELNHIE